MIRQPHVKPNQYMVTSQQSYQIFGEENKNEEFSSEQRHKTSIEEVTSDVEPGLTDISARISETCVQGCKRKKEKKEKESNRSNVLASGKSFRLISKLIGLWNPRKKHYALLCTIFVFLDISSLLAEILMPSICGPFVDRCVTYSKSVTNKTSSDSELMERVARIYETTLAFDAWHAFSDTMTYILLIYTLWRSQQRLPYLSLASAQAKLTSFEWLTINVMLIICSLAITVASAF